MEPRPYFGEYLPKLIAETSWTPCFHFDTVAGRYVVLSFLGTARHPAMARVVADFMACRHPFDDNRASVFLVTNDAEDIVQKRVADRFPGLRVFRDFNGELAKRCGLTDGKVLLAGSFVLDPGLRVVAWQPLTNPASHVAEIVALIASLPPIPGSGQTAASVPPPILVVPRVFEPEFCRELVDYYDARGGEDSGVMKDDGGRTVGAMDYGLKRRFDCAIDDAPMKTAIRWRMQRRLVPAIQRAFQFAATRLERYMVACYDSSVGGYFLPHTDNGTKGTAHRRFAASIHLNTEEYGGGEVRFPEFGLQSYRAPTGGAVVFAVSLLHEVTPVTSGRRLIFLTFLYDDADAELRARNECFIENPSLNE
jgi:predicted 2-oxoglutarate/Fe(II)-dependent dioxygenase YbiX